MKRHLCVLLATVWTLSALAGCAAPKSTDGESAPAAASPAVEEALAPAASPAYTADNEIVTYERIDPERTQITVSRTGNIDVQAFCDAFEARNPDVQVIYLDITGGSADYKPAAEWITRGYAPDVMFTASSFLGDDVTRAYFQSLSGDPIIENYEMEALQRTATDANIFWLPGPSNICAMTYNKTLFEKYGWEVPRTFDEFVALCLKISEDTNGEIEAWNPNAKYSLELLTALEGMTYAELFGGVENRSWYNDFLEGNSTFAGHMEPYYNLVKTLSDNNILREEHFSYSATTRGNEFAAGKIAMVNGPVKPADNSEFEFAFMPFPTTSGKIGYINDIYSCFVGIPVKERTEKQEDAVRRFVSFFSTPEGQTVYIGNALKISNVKNTPLARADAIGELQSAIDAGHMYAALDFNSKGKKTNIALWQQAMDITTGTKTVDECIIEADAAPFVEDAATGEPPKIEVLATATDDFTVLETSFYLADAYRAKTGADVALINNNQAFRGNLMRIFAGDMTPAIVTVLKPRSFANDSTLVKLSMSGEQLLAALNAPCDYDDGVSDSIYAYSGLDCKVAPWNPPGEKYLSVKLSDGSDIEPEKLYTVACWAGTVDDAFVTETLETIPGSFEEILSEKLSADGTIAPADDGRISLVWE